MLDLLIDLVFGSLYGAVVTLAALFAAIPYGIWQGVRRLGKHIPGGRNGDTRTG
jgi:hypothetical protein